MATTRTLLLIRHAHASPGEQDHARPLSERGLIEAKAAGAWLDAQGLAPERLIHSDARRTSETAQGIAEVLRAASLEARAELYLAEPDRLLEAATQAGGDAVCLALVAHNPGIHELADRLARRGGTQVSSFVPASVAVIEFEGAWSELGHRPTTLADYWRP